MISGMNNKDFVRALSLKTGLKVDAARELAAATFESFADVIVETGAVGVKGLGVFELRQRRERTMVNPTTGKEMQIEARQTVHLRPTK